jgi:Spy/CpxP family protein refolding chaperone
MNQYNFTQVYGPTGMTGQAPPVHPAKAGDTMNRTRRIISIASIAGAVMAISAGIAFAQTSGAGAGASVEPFEHARHDRGLLRRALQLGSLTPDQRASIEQLSHEQRATRAPVRLADAQLLSTLALQVEQGTIDRQALQPAVQAKENAALSVRTSERGALQKLHDLLTPAQRSELVDAVESLMDGRPGRDGGAGPRRLDRIATWLGLTPDQRQQIASNLAAERQAQAQAGTSEGAAHRQKLRTWLEAFRGDSFQVGAMGAPDAQAVMDRIADRAEDLLQAAVPVLTPTQRAQLASRLRARAARESRG